MAINLGAIAGANRNPAPPPAETVAAGLDFSLYNGSSPYSWGYNNLGQLGDNTVNSRRTPVAVCGGLTFSQMSAGSDWSCALTTTGIAYCWGADFYGQIGNNTRFINPKTPVAVCGGLTFSQISTGNRHTLAVTTTGVAYAWGSGANGRLGVNSVTSFSSPVAVCGGLTFSQVAAGGGHSLGITNSGIAYAWGINLNGALGDNTIISKLTPVAVCGGLTFTYINAGDTHSFGITTSGVGYAWGNGTSGRLGDNTTTQKNTPVAICGGLTFSKICGGSISSLAITTTGIAYAWGGNSSGQLGDNTTSSKSTPVAVCGGLTFSDISICPTGHHCLGVTTTGVVYAWGRNTYGALGNDTVTNTSTPVPVCTI